MKEEKLVKLLNELTERTTEPVRPGLAEEIKHHIPEKLAPHRVGMDTINIIIDLRISKLAAAAVIIITMILLANFFGGRGSTSDGGIYQNSKLLIEYCLSGSDADRSGVLAGASKLYEHLVGKGEEVVYYGDSIEAGDSNAVLMQWRISDGEYRVIFGDLRTKTVGGEELIKLQARMLQKKVKR